MRIPFLYPLIVMPIARKFDLPPVVIQFLIIASGFLIAGIVEPLNRDDSFFWLLAFGFTVGIPVLQVIIDKNSLVKPSESGQ